MEGPDEIVHQSLRLKIMAALYAERKGEPVEFTRLRALVRATDGNLGSHLATLEKADYVQVEKDYVGKRPRTRVAVTDAGARAFRRHISYLRDVLDGVE